MASIIRVKRSTGTAAPGTLQFGELGATLSGTGDVSNKGDRLFVGDNGGNVQVVGGRYYTDLLSIGPGLVAGQANPTNAARGFVAVLNSDRKVDQWNVDNLRLDANTVSTTNTDGDLYLDPNGSGEIIVPDDTKLSFGDGKDASFEYDENGTDQLTLTGADLRINIATDSATKDTGALIVEGGVGIEKSLNVGGNINVAGVSTFAGIATFTGDLYVGGDLHISDDIFLDEATIRNLKVTGISTFQNDIWHTGGTFTSVNAMIGSVGISSNVIKTKSGAGSVMYIDPYPDGLSSEGTLVVKGDLQVDGTTTTVNSNVVSVNDPIFQIGDVTSKRTVMMTVAVGVSTIKLDSVVGINTGDMITGSANLPGAGTTNITGYNSTEKLITIQGVTHTGTISTTTQLTVTAAYDTQSDRGIAFDYNTSTGVANNKQGFFGYSDAGGDSSNAPERAFTYVPDATITGNVVSGTRGYLDIKGIYFQSGDFDTTGNGIVYFDTTGKMVGAAATTSGITTSNYVLTTDANNIPKWTSTIDGGTF